MSDRKKFEANILWLLSKLTVNMSKPNITKINSLKDTLVKFQRNNVVKFNHSVMELVCTKSLVQKGYDVHFEYSLNSILICDLFDAKGHDSLIVEIETDLTPPENALVIIIYTYVHLASKIISYSSFAKNFALDVFPHCILPFSKVLAKSPCTISEAEIAKIKCLAVAYYHEPFVTINEICNAHLVWVQIIDFDTLTVQEFNSEVGLKRVIQRGVTFGYMPLKEQ
ncbi:MAG: hypothetical protein LBC03_06675 [Nitrososphaerota archaeon]|jgi:hypothetical protein|nr:hypothetical protein [Nitrososphaerota archaeon]